MIHIPIILPLPCTCKLGSHTQNVSLCMISWENIIQTLLILTLLHSLTGDSAGILISDTPDPWTCTHILILTSQLHVLHVRHVSSFPHRSGGALSPSWSLSHFEIHSLLYRMLHTGAESDAAVCIWYLK